MKKNVNDVIIYPKRIKIVNMLSGPDGIKLIAIGNDDAGYSLYVRAKEGHYVLVDGFGPKDTGQFQIYKGTFRKIKTGRKNGFMLIYNKKIGDTDTGKQWVKLLYYDGVFTTRVTPAFELNDCFRSHEEPKEIKSITPSILKGDNGKCNFVKVLVKCVDKSNPSGKTHKFDLPGYIFPSDVIVLPPNEISDIMLKNEINGLKNSIKEDSHGRDHKNRVKEITWKSWFLKNRKDVYLINFTVERKEDKYDILYLLWMDREKKLKCKKLDMQYHTDGPLNFKEFKEVGDSIKIKMVQRLYCLQYNREKESLNIE